MRVTLLVPLALVFAACGGEASIDQPGPSWPSDGGNSSTSDGAAGGDTGGPPPETLIPEDPPEPLPTGSPRVKLTTYNVGLTGILKGGEERMPFAIEALKGHDADVVCLQEVWAQFTSKADFAAAVASTYPYAFWSEEGSSTLKTGTMILSRHPLFRGRELRYTENHNLADYNLIGVDVLTDDSYFHVLCTHLFPDADAAGGVKRRAQIDEAMAWAGPLGYLDGPTFLLGDLNAGPDPIGDCTTESEPPCAEPDLATYEHIQQTFADPNLGWDQCTWCREVAVDMQMITLFDDAPSGRIDYCLSRNLGSSTFQGRELLFDQKVTIPYFGGVLNYISDHFGVACTFGP